MGNNLNFRALEILKSLGCKLEDTYTFEESKFYDVLIKTNNKKDLMYFFLVVNGELIYDGHSCNPCIPINDVCLN